MTLSTQWENPLTDNHPTVSLIPRERKTLWSFLKRNTLDLLQEAWKLFYLSKNTNSFTYYLDKRPFARRRQTAEVIRSRGGERGRKLLQVSKRAVNSAAAARPGCGDLHDTAARRPQECGTLGSAASLPSSSGRPRAPPAPLAPHPDRAKAGGLRAAQGHTAGSPPGQARPDSPCTAQPGSPVLRSPSRAAPRARRGWARGSLQGRPPLPPLPESPCPARPRSPPAQSRPGRALTAAGTRCLRPPARGRPMSERGCRGDATRPWLLGRNSAVSLPPCFPPSCPASAPRGGGDCHGPSRVSVPRGCGRPRPCRCPVGPVGRGRAGSGGERGLAAAVEVPWSCGGSGDAVRRARCGWARPSTTRRPWGALPGSAGLPAVPCPPPCAAGPRAWLLTSGLGDLLS